MKILFCFNLQFLLLKALNPSGNEIRAELYAVFDLENLFDEECKRYIRFKQGDIPSLLIKVQSKKDSAFS